MKLTTLTVDCGGTGIKASVLDKTGKVLIAHEDNITGGFGAEISASIMENCFQYLDAPVVRVAAKDSPVPFTPVLENLVLPQESDITSALKKLSSL